MQTSLTRKMTEMWFASCMASGSQGVNLFGSANSFWATFWLALCDVWLDIRVADSGSAAAEPTGSGKLLLRSTHDAIKGKKIFIHEREKPW